MERKITRRVLLQDGITASAALSAFGLVGNTPSVAADLPALDPKDPTAVTLGFVNDSSTVDLGANPSFKADQTCANCQQFKGKPGDTRGGCVLFPAKSVPAAGWCKVWRKQL